jgi:quinol monooxygenase YgiN
VREPVLAEPRPCRLCRKEPAWEATMSGTKIYARMKAKPGQEAALEDWCRKTVEAVKSDPHTVAFGFYRDEATGHVVVLEHYFDAAAAICHMKNVSGNLGDLLPLIDLDEHLLCVHGDVTPEIRDHYASWGAVYFPEIAGL